MGKLKYVDLVLIVREHLILSCTEAHNPPCLDLKLSTEDLLLLLSIPIGDEHLVYASSDCY